MARPQLPQETQKTIVLLHQEGLPIHAIAQRLKCSPGAVRNALVRRGLKVRKYAREAPKIAGIPVLAIEAVQEKWRRAPTGEEQQSIVDEARRRFGLSRKSAVRLVYGDIPYRLTPEILKQAREAGVPKRGKMSDAHREDLETLLEALKENTKGHRGPLADSNRELIEAIRETLAKDAQEAEE